MQGDARVIEFLNEQLTAELTAINQYFLHAKMQENWGYTKLAEVHPRTSRSTRCVTPSVLTDRILFLEGLPNYQRLVHRCASARPCREMFECRHGGRARGGATGCGRASS